MGRRSEDTDESKFDQVVTTSFTVDESLYEKLEALLHSLKFIDLEKRSKQRWIIEAIKEKLIQDIKPPKKERPLSVRISKALNEKIHEKVEQIKKFRSYSKRQWLFDAFYEKLERDQDKLQAKGLKEGE